MVNSYSNIVTHKDNTQNQKDIIENEYSKKDLAYYKNTEHLKKIIKLQVFFRSKLNLINNIRDVVKKLSNIVQSISKNLNVLNNYSIISNITYVTYMNKLDNIFDIFRYKIIRPINLINYGGINS